MTNSGLCDDTGHGLIAFEIAMLDYFCECGHYIAAAIDVNCCTSYCLYLCTYMPASTLSWQQLQRK